MSFEDHYLKSELYTLVREDSSIFAFLQNGSLDGIWYWDLENPENEWLSPRFWTTLGYDPREKKHLASEWQDIIFQEDLEVALDNFNKHCADPAHPYDQTVRYRHREGYTVWVRCRGLAIRDDQGKPIRMLGAHTELTAYKKVEEELRQSEERFRVLFDNAPLPYQSLDEEGHFKEVNLRWLEMLGYQREEVIGKSFADFLHPDWIDHFRVNFPRFKSIGEVLGVEFEMRRKDGDFIWVTFDGKIRRDNQGSFMQTHCVFKDITAQRRLEKKIKEQEEALRHAQKMESVGTLAGGIAHDFNNILSIILGNTDLISDETPEWSPIAEYTDEIRTAARRARDVVRQLLTFSRENSADFIPFDIISVIQESHQLIRSTTPNNIDIQLDINISIGMINGNASQINQLLINLFSNSIDAISPHPGLIDIKVTKETINNGHTQKNLSLDSGSYIKIEFRDDGSGMDEKTLGRIFDPYFTTKDFGKGSGIGLAVSHGIVEKHRGTILAQSRPGKGTTFSIFFPEYEGDIEEQEMNTPDLQSGNEKILFVDDERSIMKLGTIRLKKLGYDVIGTTDPREALEIFRDDPGGFDLIVTDMAMPKMTGDILSSKILTLRPDIPIILCTGFGENITEEIADEIGISAFIAKPADLNDFAQTIRKVLDTSFA